jgi:hypothetical protein
VSDYTKNFYELYLDYLVEPSVRKSHDTVFEHFTSEPEFEAIVDFGCGVSEIARYRKPKEYLGIDMNPEIKKYNPHKILFADYRAETNLNEIIESFKPRAFTSLFSIEITAPEWVTSVEEQVKAKYALYERIMREIKSIKYGLVSGFYYLTKMYENPVKETGGVLSYQTLEPKSSVKSNVFTEQRIKIPTPSKMFGDDVIEVWKILERRK